MEHPNQGAESGKGRSKIQRGVMKETKELEKGQREGNLPEKAKQILGAGEQAREAHGTQRLRSCYQTTAAGGGGMAPP